jgi:hypothetical protein
MLLSLIFGTLIAAANPNASDADTDSDTSDYAAPAKAEPQPYVFGWVNYPEPSVKLRGGTTKGSPVTLATEPSDAWRSLQDDEIDDVERDRRAILAMAGDYRVSFDFLEVEIYDPEASFTAPYRSWATERVIVLEDSDALISLQHILVMFIQMEDGSVQGPMLIKHWRQDWEYEPETALEFIGQNHWKTRTLNSDEREGMWQQAVYQVDDSPRYVMRGTWEHNRSFSAWNGQNSWRPLPRREHSTRSDYHALTGTNRLTINPTGWVHSQDNIKTVLSDIGTIDVDKPAIAREMGLNRYEQIVGFDFSEAESYWAKTGPYWEHVRAAWATHLSQSETVMVATHCDEKRIYELLFEAASKAGKSKTLSRKQTKKIDSIVACSVSVAD